MTHKRRTPAIAFAIGAICTGAVVAATLVIGADGSTESAPPSPASSVPVPSSLATTMEPDGPSAPAPTPGASPPAVAPRPGTGPTSTAAPRTAVSAVPPPSSTTTTSPARKSAIWAPQKGATWQWQLTSPVDQSADVAVYDIDGFTNAASVVDSLHAKGRKVICYLDVGAWESYRPDAGQFPSFVRGMPVDGYPEERWLDIRRLDILAPIMRARLDMCAKKGFDGVEFDLTDAYEAQTGFSLTGADQLAYNRFLAEEAHRRGMAAGLKNDLGQIVELLEDFEFVVNEQCWEYSECDALLPFLAAGKPVFHAEYNTEPAQYCPTLVKKGFSSIKKRVDLDAYLVGC